ncbi:hypothetical protein [uncultured Pseudacidovorax sp.]|uniref:hypothetical protein n=1 Tax=uncultured Pseudacidovorax sp. TaxID=679313 RepID=UPI0025D384D9|nr:hypothetical protein [uncultured Pseudacidovorax sp.]
MPEILPARVASIEAAQTATALVLSENDTRVRAVAMQLGYQLPADCTDPDLIQRDIAANMRRSVEACLEVGRGLRVLKEACGHGSFIARLDVLGIETRVAQKFMASAAKFANAASTPLLKAAGNQTKLFEMLVLDDEQIQELELTGQTGELSLDDVATMSVKELRAAVRQARQDAGYTAEQLEKERARADKAEKKLRGRVPVVMPLDERITPFQVEIAERQSLTEKALAAHIEAVTALEAWHTEEVTSQPDYDPTAPAPLPKPVALVLMSLVSAGERLAAMVGQLQHQLEESFGADIAEARQYLMQEPAGAGEADA